MKPLVGPVTVLVVTLQSVVIPFWASAITASQFTAARSAGVRATPARNLAFQLRSNWMNWAPVGVYPLTQLLGSGKLLASAAGRATATLAAAIALSSAARAAAITSGYLARAPGTAVPSALIESCGVMMAAESKIRAIRPSARRRGNWQRRDSGRRSPRFRK